MNRGTFLRKTALASAFGLVGADRLWAQWMNTETMEKIAQLGIQLFSLPKVLEQDFEGGIAVLAEMGYTELELFGPFSFSADSAKADWKNVAPLLGFSGSGLFGRSPEAVGALLAEHGLTVPSVHTDLDTLEHHLEAFASLKSVLGVEYITLPAIPDSRRKTLDDYKKMADTFNNIGSKARELGLKFAYHNHGYGLQETKGVTPFEVMIDATDPETVFLEMDVFWTVAGRADPVAYLKKYSGRYHLMHLKDMKPKVHFSGDGSDAAQWMQLFPNMTTAGDGALDLKGIITTAQAHGAKHFFVEQDLVEDPKTALKKSFDYLTRA